MFTILYTLEKIIDSIPVKRGYKIVLAKIVPKYMYIHLTMRITPRNSAVDIIHNNIMYSWNI